MWEHGSALPVFQPRESWQEAGHGGSSCIAPLPSPTCVTMTGDRSFRFWMWDSKESRSEAWESVGSS